MYPNGVPDGVSNNHTDHSSSQCTPELAAPELQPMNSPACKPCTLGPGLILTVADKLAAAAPAVARAGGIMPAPDASPPADKIIPPPRTPPTPRIPLRTCAVAPVYFDPLRSLGNSMEGPL